jgi:tRNA pseudouridine(55) synthase
LKLQADFPMTYSGRLDPMAEGKMFILTGKLRKNRARFDKLDKEYVFEVIFGIKTDSGDILGKVLEINSAVSKKQMSKSFNDFLGESEVSYPEFSSKKVYGRPLVQHVREGSISALKLPLTRLTVKKIDLLEVAGLPRDQFLGLIQTKLNSLKARDHFESDSGPFRIHEIREGWEKSRINLPETIMIYKFKAVVASGSYIRTLAQKMGERFGYPAFAFSIKRTEIGKYFRVFGNTGFWLKKFRNNLQI